MKNEELIEIAKQVKENALCKITGFQVGAALLCEDGSVYRGVNIEEEAIPAMSICAERNAIGNAITDGKTRYKKIAVVGGFKGEIKETLIPCGMCMQYMLDLCPDIYVICYINGILEEKKLADFFKYKYTFEK